MIKRYFMWKCRFDKTECEGWVFELICKQDEVCFVNRLLDVFYAHKRLYESVKE